MAKLLIEIDADETEIPELTMYGILEFMCAWEDGQIDPGNWKATVTNDQGEIIRESE